MLKRSILFITILFIMLITVGCGSGQGDSSSPEENGKSGEVKPQEGYLASEFELNTLDDRNISFSRDSDKPVFLNFWSTGCSICVEEMPAIQEIHEEMGDRIDVLAVNITSQETSKKNVREFIEENGYNFPVLLDNDAEVSRKYLVRSIPVSFFIDEKGKIKHRQLGAMSEAKMKDIIKNKL